MPSHFGISMSKERSRSSISLGRIRSIFSLISFDLKMCLFIDLQMAGFRHLVTVNEGKRLNVNTFVYSPRIFCQSQTHMSWPCHPRKEEKKTRSSTNVKLSIQRVQHRRRVITQLLDVSGRQHDQVAVSLEHTEWLILVLFQSHQLQLRQ